MRRNTPTATPLALTSLRVCCGLAVLLGACAADDEAPRGLHATYIDGMTVGPKVVFEPFHEPDPEIPFPNDLAMAIDADGQRHVSVHRGASTAFERRYRHHLNELPGFSAMSPISVSFDGPIDLKTVRDDTVFVVNVDPDSERYLERIPVDLGRGYFPQRTDPTSYFPHDPLRKFPQMVLPPENVTDVDDDGIADWIYHYEIATHTLDIRPLLPLEAGTQYAVVLTRGIKGWTETGERGAIHSPFAAVNHDSQTSALRLALSSLAQLDPPLAAKDVAFAWTLTTGDLAHTFRTLRDGLYGAGPFAWLAKEFPPGIDEIYAMDIDFDGLAKGDPGAHPTHDFPHVERDHQFILQGAFTDLIFGLVAQFQPDVGGSFKDVAYTVFGEMKTPSFRAPDQDDERLANVWQLNLARGQAEVVATTVPFMVTVPKTTEHHKPPFPVIVYAHATGTSRIEALLLADKFAKAGIATFTIDAVGHGPVLANAPTLIADFLGGGKIDPNWTEAEIAAAKKKQDAQTAGLIRGILGSFIYKDIDNDLPKDMPLDDLMKKLEANGFLQQLMVKGRGVDDNGDCVVNGTPGEAYYAPNPFRLRDSMRQTTLDYLVAVRMLRALGSKLPPAIADVRAATAEQLRPNLLAGDFNGDGVLDVGGPDVPYFMTGISLGGIHTALTAPLEPHIVAAAPVVAGAGLVDIFVRTKLHGVVTPLMHKASGPMVVGCPRADSEVHLSWNDESDDCKRDLRTSWQADDGSCLKDPRQIKVARAIVQIAEGRRIVLDNLDNGEQTEVIAGPNGRFALAIPADIGDRVRVQVRGSAGEQLNLAQDGKEKALSVVLRSPYEGAAKPRNTPEFRRLVQTNSNILEGADAITAAERVFLRPSAGYPATRMLLMLAVGDRTVNFAAGLSLARATGLFGSGSSYVDPSPFRDWTEKVIDQGILVDVPGVPPPLNPDMPEDGPGMCSVVDVGSGHSALCLANVGGRHEYIAQADKKDAFPKMAGYEPTYTEYHRNMIVNFFHSRGTVVSQDPCWGDLKCIEDRGLDAVWAKAVGER